MLSFSILSSGSKANCIYVSSNKTRVLFDCGLSTRETVKRLSNIGVEATSIDAVIVSHEHSDHVNGVPVFASRYKVPVYLSQITLKASCVLQKVEGAYLNYFESGKSFGLKDIEIEPFSIMHDAADPVGFRISNDKQSIGIVTDLGCVTELVRHKTKKLDAIILESNHDLEMLQNGPYPWTLKQRIASRLGHLSNNSAAKLVEELSKDELNKLQFVLAAHISEKNNLTSLAINSLESAWYKNSTSPKFAAGTTSQDCCVYAV